MSPRIAFILLSLGMLSAFACGGGAGGGSACTPGQSAACACTDGRMGAQLCGPDHSFGACTCTGGDMASIHPPPPDMATPPGPKRVFVTKTLYASTAAPKACQNSADAAGLGGTWVPWLSYRYTSGDYPAIDKITSNGPWTLITGELAFQNRGQLATAPSVPINVTEMGTVLPPNQFVWTGTVNGGTASVYTCQSWSETRNLFDGTVGSTDSTDRWTNSDHYSCIASARVYCFEL
jgi:hypothetical protein